MAYLLELPTGIYVACRDAAHARRLAELFVILTTGRPPAPTS